MIERGKFQTHKQDIAVFAVTEEGFRVAQSICSQTGAHLFVPQKLLNTTINKKAHAFQISSYTGKLSVFVPHIFGTYKGLVFVMALGIVSRVIAPLILSKYSDPAVVTVDDAARYAVSILSGHEGGANELACLIASVTGAVPVITTATEANKMYLCGIGCRKYTPAQEIIDAIYSACKKVSITVHDLRFLVAVWLKKDEPGLIEAAGRMGINLLFIPKWMIKYAHGLYEKSDFVYSKIGVGGACEPAALLAGRNTSLILKKQIIGNVTVAVAKEELSSNLIRQVQQ